VADGPLRAAYAGQFDRDKDFISLALGLFGLFDLNRLLSGQDRCLHFYSVTLIMLDTDADRVRQ